MWPCLSPISFSSNKYGDSAGHNIIYVLSTKKEYWQLHSQMYKEAVSVFNLKNLLILAFTLTKLFLFYEEFYREISIVYVTESTKGK